ncbi:MAG: AEC family transporter [Afipia sp.]|nr:AEC family transporter [Afipia sp.]
MPVVVAALLPVFLLIAMGFALKQFFMKHESQWAGLEQIVFYVLFPALLIQTLARADLAAVPVFDVGGALIAAVLIGSAFTLALRPFIMNTLGASGPAFTSVFQGAVRWQTYVGLAVVSNLYGSVGLTLASVAVVAMIPILNIIAVWVLAHYASPQKLSWNAVMVTIAKNPFIWACAVGLAFNLLHMPLSGPVYDFMDALGRSSLAIGLLCVGAGLRLQGIVRATAPAWVSVAIKLVLMPLIAIAVARLLGLTGTNLAVVACCASVPTASSAYVMARQMGGDAPLLAEILTMQTILAAVTMPIFIAWVA